MCAALDRVSRWRLPRAGQGDRSGEAEGEAACQGVERCLAALDRLPLFWTGGSWSPPRVRVRDRNGPLSVYNNVCARIFLASVGSLTGCVERREATTRSLTPCALGERSCERTPTW
jgi:hypothetical protein